MTMSRPRRSRLVCVSAASLVLAACGGGGDDEASSTADAATSTVPATTTTLAPETTTTVATVESTAPATTEPGGVIDSFDEVQPAVVQIIATGTIRDPEVGFATQAGSGSGFIVSEDGLVVTNNHVVTGAATLEVFVGGDDSRSYNARVVGVSECNDLALIQLDVDEPLPTLVWQEGDPTVGQEVYAAGFPLGDPEFTLTRGIVAKAEASGETPWASIDFTLEHDANIQPGNSGGPLVSATGEVVAVNYATGSQTNTSQFFAIDSSLAQDVVAELMEGDFESLGINGQAVLDEEAGIAGVWVAGVAPGSPIDLAGVLPGDIVTSLNGLPIGTDGTMKDYCDVLRTSGTDKPIDIEVLRFDTSEVLSGQVNGEGPIELSFSFAQEVGAVDPAAAGYSGYTTLVDDTGVLTIDVPNEWADIYTAPLELDDGTLLPIVQASTDIDAYDNTYDVPGLVFTAVEARFTIAEALDLLAPGEGECLTESGVLTYEDAVYTGVYQAWFECGNNGATYLTLVAVPEDGSYSAVMAVQILSDADWEALDQAFNTFFVVLG